MERGVTWHPFSRQRVKHRDPHRPGEMWEGLGADDDGNFGRELSRLSRLCLFFDPIYSRKPLLAVHRLKKRRWRTWRPLGSKYLFLIFHPPTTPTRARRHLLGDGPVRPLTEYSLDPPPPRYAPRGEVFFCALLLPLLTSPRPRNERKKKSFSLSLFFSFQSPDASSSALNMALAGRSQSGGFYGGGDILEEEAAARYLGRLSAPSPVGGVGGGGVGGGGSARGQGDTIAALRGAAVAAAAAAAAGASSSSTPSSPSQVQISSALLRANSLVEGCVVFFSFFFFAARRSRDEVEEVFFFSREKKDTH